MKFLQKLGKALMKPLQMYPGALECTCPDSSHV